MGFWSDFKKAGRDMYGIPEGMTAARFIASLPVDYVKYVRGEAVSAAYSARRTKGLQAVMNYQQMGGASREYAEKSRGGELPKDYYATRDAAHQALVDFPEIKDWIDESAIM